MGTSYSILNARETLALADRFLPRIDGFDLQNKYLNALGQFIMTEQSELKQSLGITTGSPITVQITDTDEDHGNRSKDFRDLILLKKSLTILPEESAAAAKVAAVFDEFGHRVYDLPREEQLIQTDAMVEVFSSEGKIAAITTAGALPLFDAYKTTHFALKDLIRQRTAESEAEIGESASKLGRALGRSLNDLYEHVEKYSRIGESNYATLLEQLDLELSDIVPQAKARRTRNRSD